MKNILVDLGDASIKITKWLDVVLFGNFVHMGPPPKVAKDKVLTMEAIDDE